tara:strand:+ start:368 stop:580 length:213 start_codon:yes stop_codon:yes gene_type:complete
MKKKVLDVTKEKCPMTFLKVKIFIQENHGFEKVILVKGKKDFLMLKDSLEKNFLVKTEQRKKNIFQLVIS